MSDIDLSLDYTKYPETGVSPDAPAGQAAIAESLNDRANELALAAGAQPGETAIVDGVKRTVKAAAASPSAPSKKPANKRLDPHPPVGDPYLIQAITDAVGNYFGISLDKTALGSIKGTVNADGTYNARTTDADGTVNESAQNGRKVKAASETKTVAGHSDSGTGGGTRSTVKKGEHKENDGASTGATNGPKAETTAQSAKTFAQGGNGPQRIKGDYSLSSEEGGLHFEAAKEITMTAKGKNIGLSTKTGTITLTAGDNKIVIGPLGITIDANTGPIIVYSRNLDVHVAANKYVSVQSYTKDVTINTPAGKIDLNP